MKKKEIEKKDTKNTKKVTLGILSLIVTIALIFLIVRQIQLINQNGASTQTLIFLIIECVSIFVVPCLFNPQIAIRRIIDQFSGKEQYQPPKDENIPLPSLEFSPDQHRPIIIKCPKCNFENPGRRKRCLNCGEDLIW